MKRWLIVLFVIIILLPLAFSARPETVGEVGSTCVIDAECEGLCVQGICVSAEEVGNWGFKKGQGRADAPGQQEDRETGQAGAPGQQDKPTLGCKQKELKKTKGGYEVLLDSSTPIQLGFTQVDGKQALQIEGFESMYINEQQTPGQKIALYEDAGKWYISNTQTQTEVPVELYGVAIASKGQHVLRTYELDGPLVKLLFGDSFIIYDSAKRKLFACELEGPVPECSDQKDNNDNGFIDYTGGCGLEGELFYICGCYNLNEDDFADVGEGITCTENEIYGCLDLDYDEFVPDMICADENLDHYDYEVNCISPETESEGSADKTKNCVETYYFEVCDYCMTENTKAKDCNSCIKKNPAKMESWCEVEYYGADAFCIDNKDCPRGEVCDANLGCVSAENYLEEFDTDVCTEIEGCKKGFTCAEGVCVKEEELGITDDNPFLGPIKGLVETVEFVVADKEGKLELLEEEQRDDVLDMQRIKEQADEGLITDERAEKLRERKIEDLADNVEETTELVEQQIEEGINIDQARKSSAKMAGAIERITQDESFLRQRESEAGQRFQQTLEEASEVLEEVAPAGVAARLAEGKTRVETGRQIVGRELAEQTEEATRERLTAIGEEPTLERATREAISETGTRRLAQFASEGEEAPEDARTALREKIRTEAEQETEIRIRQATTNVTARPCNTSIDCIKLGRTFKCLNNTCQDTAAQAAPIIERKERISLTDKTSLQTIATKQTSIRLAAAERITRERPTTVEEPTGLARLTRLTKDSTALTIPERTATGLRTTERPSRRTDATAIPTLARPTREITTRDSLTRTITTKPTEGLTAAERIAQLRAEQALARQKALTLTRTSISDRTTLTRPTTTLPNQTVPTKTATIYPTRTITTYPTKSLLTTKAIIDFFIFRDKN